MSDAPTRDELLAEVARLRRQFEQFVQFLPDALIEVDLASARLEHANRMAHIVGYGGGELAGLPSEQLFAPGEFERAARLARERAGAADQPPQAYERSGRNELFEFTMRRRDGSLFPAETQSSYVLDAAGRPLRLRSIVRDATERKAVEAQLEALSLRDPLTGCYNRRHLARLRLDLERPTSRWSCVVFDLKKLKAINDNYGHAEGDRVLRGFAHFLGLHHRSDDVLLRLGGDEFALLLPSTGEAEAQTYCERLSDAGRQGSPAEFSLGLATRRAGETVDEAMARADQAMYATRGRELSRPRDGDPQ